MSTPEQITRHQIERIESRIVWLSQELHRAEGVRDSLVRDLVGNEGAHDQRPVGVR